MWNLTKLFQKGWLHLCFLDLCSLQSDHFLLADTVTNTLHLIFPFSVILTNHSRQMWITRWESNLFTATGWPWKYCTFMYVIQRNIIIMIIIIMIIIMMMIIIIIIMIIILIWLYLMRVTLLVAQQFTICPSLILHKIEKRHICDAIKTGT